MNYKKIFVRPFSRGLFFVGIIYWGSFHHPIRVVCEELSQPSNQAASKIQKASKVSLNSDQFSGKSITSKEMTFKIVEHRESNAPHVGEIAPDFFLKSASGNSEFSLTELRKTKPVVLIMASWGCGLFRETVPGLRALHERYKNHVNFVMIYIREAHSLDGSKEGAQIKDPKTILERMEAATACRKQLQLPFSVLVDSINDPVMTRWAALPLRIYVVGTDGKIAYAGPQGPWGYHPYQGYQHGNGQQLAVDFKFSQGSLEEFLAKSYPAKPLTKYRPIGK